MITYIIYLRNISNIKEDINFVKTTNDNACSAINCEDTGIQKRVVKCYDPDSDVFLPDSKCSNLNMPPESQSCVNKNCVMWSVDPWSSVCNICRQPSDPAVGTKNITRNVYCPSSDQSNCNQNVYDPVSNPMGKPPGTMMCVDVVCTALSGHYTATKPPDQNPFQDFTYVSGNINNISVLNNTIFIPSGLVGSFMLSIVWYGVESRVATFIPVVEYSNISPLNYLGAGTKSIIQNSSVNEGSSRVLFFLATFSIVDRGTSSTIMFDGNFALPTSSNSADLFLVKLNDNVNISCNPCDSRIGNLPLLAYHQILSPTIQNVFGGRKLIFDSIGISVEHNKTATGPVYDITIPYSESKFMLVMEWTGDLNSSYSSVVYSNIDVKSSFNKNTLKKASNDGYMTKAFLYMTIFTLKGPSDGTIIFYATIPSNALGDIFLIELDA